MHELERRSMCSCALAVLTARHDLLTLSSSLSLCLLLVLHALHRLVAFVRVTLDVVEWNARVAHGARDQHSGWWR